MREMMKMVLVLSLICGLSGLTLASLRQATSERIEEQVLTYVQGPALAQIFPDVDNNPVKDRMTFQLESGPVTIFPGFKDGKLTSVAFETLGKGYGGDIGVLVGLSTIEEELRGIGITMHKETPGLGAKIVEQAFRSQFVGHTTKAVKLEKDGGDIAAIAGATSSSTGTVFAINQAIRIFKNLKGKLSDTWGS